MPTPKGSVPWNKGTGRGWTDGRGYRWLYVEEGGKRRARREHRVLMERHLGRKLEPWEVVHHKDGDPFNNAIDNLEVKEHGEHTVHHHTGQHHSPEAKKSMEAFAQLREEITHLRQINADLLAALQGVLRVADRQTDEFDAARAAIAKATQHA